MSYSGSFVQYGWTGIIDRCENLSNSGGVLTTNRYYFHKDNLGSVVGITDNSGTTVTEYSYDSYGKVTLSGVDIGNERLYTGREYDEETGLYYNRARYYDPNLGRFISRDPIGINDDVNLYSYVGNSPVGSVDRMGLNSKKIVLTIYSDRGHGKQVGGYHSWIEVNIDGKVTTYGFYPAGNAYKIGEKTNGDGIYAYSVEGVNENIETFKKIDTYTDYTSFSTEITKDQYETLVESIQKDIDNGESWGLKPRNYGVCSNWASDKWNKILGGKYFLWDKNIWGFSTPNALANSIDTLKSKK